MKQWLRLVEFSEMPVLFLSGCPVVRDDLVL